MRWKDSPRAMLFALLVIHVMAHIDRNMLLGLPLRATKLVRRLSTAQVGLCSASGLERQENRSGFENLGRAILKIGA